MEIAEQLKRNKKFYDYINTLTVKVTIDSDKKREMLFRGFFNTFRTHYISINILLEKKLYSSAFALIRVMFDAMVRGLYMFNTYSNERIESVYADSNWNFDKTTTMCKKLDEIFGNNFFDELRSGAYGGMCDYTHTGSTQIARNFNQEAGIVEKNFDDSLIIDTLNGVYKLMKIFTLAYFEKTGLKHGEITTEEMTIISKA